MALVEKVAALREQIGVAAGGGSIPDDVQAIAKQLGIWEKVQGKPLLEQVDECYHIVFADAKPAATADVKPQVVVVTGQPVTSVLPGVVSLAEVAVEPTPTPKPKADQPSTSAASSSSSAAATTATTTAAANSSSS